MSWHIIGKLICYLYQRSKSQYGFLIRAAVWPLQPLEGSCPFFPLSLSFYFGSLKGDAGPRDWTWDPRIPSSTPYPCRHGRVWVLAALYLVLFYLALWDLPKAFCLHLGCLSNIALLLNSCMCHHCSRSHDHLLGHMTNQDGCHRCTEPGAGC